MKNKNYLFVGLLAVVILCTVINIVNVISGKEGKLPRNKKEETPVDLTETIDAKFTVNEEELSFVLDETNDEIFFDDNTFCSFQELTSYCSMIKRKGLENFVFLSEDGFSEYGDVIEVGIKYTFKDKKDYLLSLSSIKLYFQTGDYKIYREKCNVITEDEEEMFRAPSGYYCEGDYKYYVYNKNNGLFTTDVWAFDNGDNDRLYAAYNEGEELVLVFNANTKKLSDKYDEYNCEWVSDVSNHSCNNSALIVNNFKNDKNIYGVISDSDFKTIISVEYDTITEDDFNNFIVLKDNKMGVFSVDGKVRLKVEYDYIASEEGIGYLAIKGNDLHLYNKFFEEISLENNTLMELYEKENRKLQAEDGSVEMKNAQSYYWSSLTYLIKANVGKKYKFNDYNYFEYTAKDHNGEKLVLFDQRGACYADPVVYVIENNKVYKLDSSKIKINYEDCF